MFIYCQFLRLSKNTCKMWCRMLQILLLLLLLWCCCCCKTLLYFCCCLTKLCWLVNFLLQSLHFYAAKVATAYFLGVILTHKRQFSIFTVIVPQVLPKGKQLVIFTVIRFTCNFQLSIIGFLNAENYFVLESFFYS